MSKKFTFLITGLFALIGGIIWLYFGVELSMLDPGMPSEHFYRNSQPLMPWLGIGLFCIGIGLTGLYVSIACPQRLARWTFIVALVGCVLYLFGTISRISMDLGSQYEFVMPIGYLMTAVGLLGFSGSVLRSNLLPIWCKVLLLLSAVLLLTFNDQFITSWSSVPFGISWIGLSLYLFRRISH